MALFSKCSVFFTMLTVQICLLVIHLIINYPNSRSRLIYNQVTQLDHLYSLFMPIDINHSAENDTHQRLSNESFKDLFRETNNTSSVLSTERQNKDINTTSLHVDKLTWLNELKGTDTNNTKVRVTIRQVGFQSVDNRQAWVYSAYFDHVAVQNGHLRVRVFGVVHQDLLLKVYCHFSSDKTNSTTSGQFINLPESHDKPFRPTLVDCNLTNHEQPLYVSVSFQSTSSPTNQVPVQYPGPRIRNFTVCYSVLHKQYDKTVELIQSIEMNRILGAEHFMVYNYSISPRTDQILRKYQQDGLVTVLPWLIPTLQSWYFGQIAALCDCIYRNRNASRFVVVLDMDELIILRNHSSWMDLIDSLSPQELHISPVINSSVSKRRDHNFKNCFIFKSSFFMYSGRPNWNSLPSEYSFTEEERNNVLNYQIRGLSQFGHSHTIYEFNIRSKYIACTDQIEFPGIHYVHKFVTPGECLNVNPDLARIHHYRHHKGETGDVYDTSILRFKHKLYPSIMKQFQRFPNIFS